MSLPQTKAKHTPGAWAVGGVDGALWVTGPDRTAPVICDIVPRKHEEAPTEEDEANADLIAAAPDLLQALTRIWHFSDDTSHALHPDERWVGVREDIREIARAALAKARGEEVAR